MHTFPQSTAKVYFSMKMWIPAALPLVPLAFLLLSMS